MMFPTNFLIEAVTSTTWMLMNLGFYVLIFQYVQQIGVPGTDGAWEKYQFFVFIATTMLVNSLVQAFFMPNVQEFSNLIRMGNLDFALLKPIDTQFIVSFHRVNWSSLSNFVVGCSLLGYALPRIEGFHPTLFAMLCFPLYVILGVLILYSVMISLASTSIWLGRNQSLANFWFYITNFSRYPMEIYRGDVGDWLRRFFTFIIPILVVINVPARMMAKPLQPAYWQLALFAIVATGASLTASRWIFQRALLSYRSASS